MAVLTCRLTIMSVLVGLCFGCNVQSEEGRFPSLDSGDDWPDAGVSQRLDSGSGTVFLNDASGHWLVFMQDRICIVGEIGEPVDNLIWSTYLITIGESAGGPVLPQDIELCSQSLSPLPFGFITVVPDRLTDALSTHQVSGFLVGRRGGDAYLTEPFVDLWGAEGVGADDDMPIDVADPRIVDQDGDGEPGVSLTVASPDGMPICEVRVVQRTTIQFNGQIETNSKITGDFEAQQSKVVLGATSPLCESGGIEMNRGRTFFTMVRIDGRDGGPSLDDDGNGVIDCHEVRNGSEAVRQAYGVVYDEPDTANCQPASDEP